MPDRVKKDERRTRRKYTKPELRSIDLVADQVMAVGCKMDGWASLATPCNANNCYNSGS